MRLVVLLSASLLATSPLSSQRSQREVPAGGQWLIARGDEPGKVHLNVRYGSGWNTSNWGRQIPMSELAGLSAADMDGPGKDVHFRIVRSAGTLTCDGWFQRGEGSGHFTYQPNPGFVA